MRQLTSLDDFDTFTKQADACLVYFSHQDCSVCNVLKPKITKLCDQHFPLLQMAYADTVLYPEIAGQQGVFTVPVVLVYFEGKEYLRVARNFSIPEFQSQVEKYYHMIF